MADLSAGLEQPALNGSRKARIVELDRQVLRPGLAGGGVPRCADLEAGFLREDAVVGSLLAALALYRLEVHFRLERERLDRAGEAVFRRLESSDDSHSLSPFRIKTTPCGLLYGPFAEV